MTRKRKSITDLRIAEYDNPPILRSQYPFEYEPSNAAGLKELRRRYALDRVIAKGKTEFEQMLLLRDWVSRRWNHGYCNVDKWSKTGLEYLRRAEKGECFTCAVYAFTLTEVMTAMGFPARNLTMAQANTDFIGPEDDIGHCITEVWSNQFRKWLVLDADSAAHFELDGIPLNAMEIRAAWLGRRAKRVKFVRGPHIPRLVSMGPPGTPPMEKLQFYMRQFFKNNTMDYYDNLEFHMSNRHFTPPKRPRFLLVWSDRDSPPRIVRQNMAVDPQLRVTTELKSDVYYTLNHAYIRLHCPRWCKGKPVPTLTVRLETETPWFSHFEARADKGEWRRRPARFTWSLGNGVNVIEARPVNKFGRQGIISRVKVLCKMR